MKNHYICEDLEGNLFMTTEKCVSTADAQQYVGENKVLYPFLQNEYEKNTLPLKEFIDAENNLKQIFSKIESGKKL